MLQVCCCIAPVDAAHIVPPCAATVLTLYERVCEPLPHVSEQELHDPQSPTQSTGHASELQLCTCVTPADTEHASPPFCAPVLTLYERVCVPPPHVAEHEPHEPHAPTHATGHPSVLHACSLVAPAATEQATPPLVDC